MAVEYEKGEKSLQWKRRQERLRRVNAAKGVRRVRVNPRDETIRRDIRHMPGGIRFPATGSVEWPLDQFTKKLLRAGAVTIAEDQQQQRKPAPTHHRSTSTSSS